LTVPNVKNISSFENTRWRRYLDRGLTDFDEIWHTDALITTCPGINIALEEGFDQAGKAGFGVLHAAYCLFKDVKPLLCYPY